MWTAISETVGYMKGAVNQGIIFSEKGAILIDTGLDKQAAKKLIRFLHEKNINLSAIINTHSHADHIGGNHELVSHFGDGVKVYAPIFEESAIRHPIWEPIYLYGGAYPLAELQNKFLCAPSSPVHHVIEPGTINIDGVTLKIVPLYGHAYRQMGVVYKDVLFAADGFFGREVLDKHPIPFHVETKETLETLTWLESSEFLRIIPGHGAMIENHTELKTTIAHNRVIYDRVIDTIYNTLNAPMVLDELIPSVCNALHIEIKNAGSYLLYATAIRALLKYMSDQGMVSQELRDNRWLWVK